MQFLRLKGRKSQADFEGGAITSDAVAVRLREVDKRIGLIDAQRYPAENFRQTSATLVGYILYDGGEPECEYSFRWWKADEPGPEPGDPTCHTIRKFMKAIPLSLQHRKLSQLASVCPFGKPV
jgi:hypothetical protein